MLGINLMKNNHLSKTAHEHTLKFIEAFNSGDPNLVISMYEVDAIMSDKPGHFVKGSELFELITNFLKLGLPMQGKVKQIYATDDTALLIVDWSIKGKNSNNEDVNLSGTGTDVIRKGVDGYWRFTIDNPWGISDE